MNSLDASDKDQELEDRMELESNDDGDDSDDDNNDDEGDDEEKNLSTLVFHS